MHSAIYAGSFDLLTNCHLWMIEEGVKLFGGLQIAIGVNPDKKTMFTLDERAKMLQDALASLESKVVISVFERSYLVKYAKEQGASYLLRGVRSSDDFRFERVMRHINHDIEPSLRTVLLIPPRELSEVSSSMVKGLIGPEGWEDVVRRYVPPTVSVALSKRFASQ